MRLPNGGVCPISDDFETTMQDARRAFAGLTDELAEAERVGWLRVTLELGERASLKRLTGGRPYSLEDMVHAYIHCVFEKHELPYTARTVLRVLGTARFYVVIEKRSKKKRRTQLRSQ